MQRADKMKNKTQNFYDRIADVHDLMMKINGYRDSVAKYLCSLNLKIDSESYVLDAGSGTGIVTKGFHKAGFHPKKPFALDLSLKSLKVSREQFKKEKKTMKKILLPCKAIFCIYLFPMKHLNLF